MIQRYEIQAATWKQLYRELCKAKKISTIQQKEIESKLHYLLMKQLRAYNRNRSTSMPRKKFKPLQKGMLYTLDHALPETDQTQFFIQTTLEEQIVKGETKIQEIIDEITDLWLACRKVQLGFYNERYSSILNEQIPKFLHAYDGSFFPHQCFQDLDYPLWDGLAMDHSMYNKKGCDLVKEYLTRFALEQNYAQRFQKELPDIINAYEELHDVSITYVGVNVCTILLPLHVCHQLLPQNTLMVSKDAYEYVSLHLDTLKKDDWENVIQKMKLEVGCESFLYFQPAIMDTIQQLLRAKQEGWLSQLLLQRVEDTRQLFTIQATSSTINFEKIYTTLSQIASMDEKITTLKQLSLSIPDLIDLFENDIFFDQEYLMYFHQCSYLEIALYLYISKPEEFVFHSVPTIKTISKWEAQTTWQRYLFSFIQTQNSAYWDELHTIFTSIKFSMEG